jgi:hypothetical protein
VTYGRWIAPLVEMAMRRANKKDLLLLKRRLEPESR